MNGYLFVLRKLFSVLEILFVCICVCVYEREREREREREKVGKTMNK